MSKLLANVRAEEMRLADQFQPVQTPMIRGNRLLRAQWHTLLSLLEPTMAEICSDLQDLLGKDRRSGQNTNSSIRIQRSSYLASLGSPPCPELYHEAVMEPRGGRRG